MENLDFLAGHMKFHGAEQSPCVEVTKSCWEVPSYICKYPSKRSLFKILLTKG